MHVYMHIYVCTYNPYTYTYAYMLSEGMLLAALFLRYVHMHICKYIYIYICIYAERKNRAESSSIGAPRVIPPLNM